MIQWWFWCAISEFMNKLIILRLLFIYFNYAINQSIILHHSLPILSSCAAGWHRRVPKVPQQCHALEDLVFIYLARGWCTLNVLLLVIVMLLGKQCWMFFHQHPEHVNLLVFQLWRSPHIVDHVKIIFKICFVVRQSEHTLWTTIQVSI